MSFLNSIGMWCDNHQTRPLTVTIHWENGINLMILGKVEGDWKGWEVKKQIEYNFIKKR